MKNLQLPLSFFVFLLLSFFGCSSGDAVSDNKFQNSQNPVDPEDEGDDEEEGKNLNSIVYLGADLSYVNEMEGCGGVYKNEKGEVVDPFTLFSNEGANLVRVRLWHSPEWTEYSDFEDVKKTIRRAKEKGMEVLLDFHYSDTWADPSKQFIPEAWENIEDTDILADSVYNYTYSTLAKLAGKNLIPDIVQVGNETNSEILMPGETSGSINWDRNIQLLNTGLRAVKDFSEEENTEVETMLHVAQPENALWWFKEAEANGIDDYDWIGLSYYPVWSDYSLDRLPQAIKELKQSYGKRIMVVETAYPHSLDNVDEANNILGDDALIPGYEASPKGQREYLMDLARKLDEGGAEGLIYWEPAWISTECSTLWGQGSHWDNATFFDAETSKALPAFEFYNRDNY